MECADTRSTLPVESLAETQAVVSGSWNVGFDELAASETASVEGLKISVGDAIVTGYTIAGTIEGSVETAEYANTEVPVGLFLTADERTTASGADESGGTPLTTEFVSTTGDDV